MSEPERRLTLVKTCDSCPEQYDVYDNDRKIGYMRLRHGWFSVDYCGKHVYEASPRGDGGFYSEERTRYLNEGCRAILAAMSDDDEEPIYEIGELKE